MKKEPALPGTMAAAIEASLVKEFASLLHAYMRSVECCISPRLRWQIDFDELAAAIGSRHARLTLRMEGFAPLAYGIWERPPRTSDPSDLEETEELDVSELADQLALAINHLDPLGVLDNYRRQS